MSDIERLDPLLVEVFEREILEQWEFVGIAVGAMNQTLRESEAASMPVAPAFWFALHALLSAFGNISKVFWPSGGRPSDSTLRRCEQLRAEYDVSDSSLLGDRTVRNDLEHLDERIDTWWATSERRNLADRIVAPIHGAIVGLDPSDYLRWFDPTTNTVWVIGDSLDIQALVSEVEDLVGRVRERAADRSRIAGS